MLLGFAEKNIFADTRGARRRVTLCAGWLFAEELLGAAATPPPARCIHWSPDAEGINGIFLSKEIIDEAAKVIEDVMRAITPRVGCALRVVLWLPSGCL